MAWAGALKSQYLFTKQNSVNRTQRKQSFITFHTSTRAAEFSESWTSCPFLGSQVITWFTCLARVAFWCRRAHVDKKPPSSEFGSHAILSWASAQKPPNAENHQEDTVVRVMALIPDRGTLEAMRRADLQKLCKVSRSFVASSSSN